VSIYTIEVHHLVHTCPGNPEPHPVPTWHRVLHVTPGGPCRMPVTVRCGDTTTVIPCRRHEPSERQCANCRTIIRILKVTSRDLGYQGPAPAQPTLFGAVSA
jgi:hypothetical protein